jgi:zinc protease
MQKTRLPLVCVLPALVAFLTPIPARAADAPTTVPTPAPVEFQQETLDNGLRVIYAPLRQAPVVHVRVLYHVGSRDERPDRQGFAHMFEHMMFRGSAHVKPEEHMKLIGVVGGNSNAFTSFDQTTYVNTIPSNHLEMALYLEADRMSSFKVNENIYKTERKVVAEEWRIRQNRPYGTQFEDFLAKAFTTHSYRWTPIGNMEHLKQAEVAELQDFFNTYYLPNNATLIIAGDIDIEKTRAMVKRFYGWIPKGPDVKRAIPQEPDQTEPRQAVVNYRVPLPAILVGWHLPPYKSDDHYGLALLATIMGDGDSSRLDRLLVHGAKPLAVRAGAGTSQLEDAGLFEVEATVLGGRDADEVEKQLRAAVAEVVEKGVTAEELEKAKTQARVALIAGRQTCTSLAAQLGEEAVFGGDANRVNTALAKINALTVDDVNALAKKYLQPQGATTLRVKPDPTGAAARAEAGGAAGAAKATAEAPVKPPTREAQARVVNFPPDYPTGPMMGKALENPKFQKGQETTINGVKVIVMSDHRLPLVDWNLTMRRGADSDPKGKEGLANIAGDLLRAGAGDLSRDALSLELESRGISLNVGSGGDTTSVSGSSTTPQLDRGIDLTRLVLLSPTFPADEFRKLQEQMVNSLSLRREDARFVASRDLNAALYGDTPLGTSPTPESVASITLDDVKGFYKTYFRPRDAILMISGDVTVERGRKLAKKLLDGWTAGDATLPEVDYKLPSASAKRKIVLVDRPGGKQSVIQVGIRAYDIRSEEKFPGSVASTILTSGIESRLGRYVRAEKGLTYGVSGRFAPGRHGGAFVGATDTAVESTADTVEAMFKVFDDMRKAEVTPVELAESKTRVAGGMVMGMQTIQQQAGYRVDAILNDYPIDYYDTYPQKIDAVTAAQVREVMNKYVKDGEMVIVVVAPAEAVKDQLKRLGEVEVVPMPAKREGAKDLGKNELLRKAA